MKRFLFVICLAFSVSPAGCVLDNLRRDDGHISRMGGSAKARQIEEDLDWGTSF